MGTRFSPAQRAPAFVQRRALVDRAVLRWATGFGVSEYKTYSQNGEDGVIARIFEMIPPVAKTYVEFGVEAGVECNTRLLRENGWTGLMMDGDHVNPSTNLHMERIDPENIVDLFLKHGVNREHDLLSVDLDCFDWYITRNILRAGFRPRVIINEVNSRIDHAPPLSVVVSRNWSAFDRASVISRCVARRHADNRSVCALPEPQGPGEQPVPYCRSESRPHHTDFFSASVSAYHHLYRAYNYSMVYCENRGTNCFGVRDDLLAPLLAARGMRRCALRRMRVPSTAAATVRR